MSWCFVVDNSTAATRFPNLFLSAHAMAKQCFWCFASSTGAAGLEEPRAGVRAIRASLVWPGLAPETDKQVAQLYAICLCERRHGFNLSLSRAESLHLAAMTDNDLTACVPRCWVSPTFLHSTEDCIKVCNLVAKMRP